jgi:hypothetical protein
LVFSEFNKIHMIIGSYVKVRINRLVPNRCGESGD